MTTQAAEIVKAHRNGNGASIAAPNKAQTIEDVLLRGNLADLNPEQKVTYVKDLCDSLGINFRTQPFAFITFQGKEVLYAKRDLAEQLRKKEGISIEILAREKLDDIYIVAVRATRPDGRKDESIGVVNFGNLKGVDAANAIMKCETKAKRRVTLSICGLGILDESEFDTLDGEIVGSHNGDNSPINKGIDAHKQLGQFTEKETKIEPLENPWLHCITKGPHRSKRLCELDDKIFNGARIAFEQEKISEVDFVNIEAAFENQNLKQAALDELVDNNGVPTFW